MEKESLGILVSIIHRLGSVYLSQKLDRYGIGSAQHAYLLYIAEADGVSQDDIVRHFKIDKAAVARGLQKLESAGYITRAPNSHDRRAYHLHLTATGRAIIPDIKRTLCSWSESLSEGISPGLLSNCHKALLTMTRNAEKMVNKEKTSPDQHAIEYREV